jgi:hypothetical protein
MSTKPPCQECGQTPCTGPTLCNGDGVHYGSINNARREAQGLPPVPEGWTPSATRTAGHPADTHYFQDPRASQLSAKALCGLAVGLEANYTGDVARVTCDPCLAKVPERSLSGAIDALECRLATLYLARRGRVIDGQEPQDPELGGPCWGWCVSCGKAQVNAGDGNDTCPTCLERA